MSLRLRDTTPSTTCYNIDGTRSPFDSITYIPCNITAIEHGQHSACCAPNDLCLTNGLCKYNNPDPSANFNEYWRIGCTDPTYEDAACPKQCGNIERDDPRLPTHLVFQCPGDGKWCCSTGHLRDFKARGSVNTTCCDVDGLAFDDTKALVYATAQSVTLDLDTAMSETKTSAESTAINTATRLSTTKAGSIISAATSAIILKTGAVTPSSIPASTPTSTAASNGSSDSLAAGIGAGVGIPLGIALLIAVVWLILRHRRQKKSRGIRFGNGSQEHFESRDNFSGHGDVRSAYPHAFYAEPGRRELPVELYTTKVPFEMVSPTSPPKALVSGRDKTYHLSMPDAPQDQQSREGVWEMSGLDRFHNEKKMEFGASDLYR